MLFMVSWRLKAIHEDSGSDKSLEKRWFAIWRPGEHLVVKGTGVVSDNARTVSVWAKTSDVSGSDRIKWQWKILGL